MTVHNTVLSRLFPFLRWNSIITRDTLRADTIAGLTGALVVLPQGVAFATIAGMPPEYGLYAGIIPAIIAALFGSSWHLVSGPTTAASVVLFSILSKMAEPGTEAYITLALTLTCMVGLLQLGMGLFRLGVLVNFISHAVVLGFTAGAAIHIALNQLKHFTGINIPRGADPFETLNHFFTHINEAQIAPLAVGFITLATGIICKKFFPRFPYMISALIVGAISAALLQKIMDWNIPTVGALPASLPPLSSPSFNYTLWRELAPAAVAVALFALTEAVSISRALAIKSGQRINGNQEFIGQGLSNIAGSFFSGYVATGSFNRSGVNYEAGAKTPVAAILAGLFLAVAVVFVAPYAAWLPNAAMAGVLFLVAWGLFDRKHIAHIFHASRPETAVMLTTFGIAILVDLEHSILIGVLLSMMVYLGRTSRPRLTPMIPARSTDRSKLIRAKNTRQECPQIRILRIDGSLFFGAVAFFQDNFARLSGEHKHIVLNTAGLNFLDSSGADAIAHEAKDIAKRGGTFSLLNLKTEPRLALKRGSHLTTIGTKNIHNTNQGLIQTLTPKLDKELCRNCPLFVFNECEKLKNQDS